MATYPPADNNLTTLDDIRFDGQSQLANGVAVAEGAIEVIYSDVHCSTDKFARVIVRDEAEMVAKSLCTKWDYRYFDIAFTPPSTRHFEFVSHSNQSSLRSR
jgi:hypothetical protein